MLESRVYFTRHFSRRSLCTARQADQKARVGCFCFHTTSSPIWARPYHFDSHLIWLQLQLSGLSWHGIIDWARRIGYPSRQRSRSSHPSSGKEKRWKTGRPVKTKYKPEKATIPVTTTTTATTPASVAGKGSGIDLRRSLRP